MTRALIPLLVLAACGPPLAPYWETVDDTPVITGVFPESTDTLLGGGLLEIRGVRMDGVQTVVVGSRNAEILEALPRRVIVRVPRAGAAGGPVDVTVVSDDGWHTREDAFTYATDLATFTAAETASAAVMRYDCPIEATGTQRNGRATAIFYCGAEAGFGDGIGYLGTTPQPGFAGDLEEILPLSLLPPPGETVLYAPGDDRALALPISFSAHLPTDTLEITAARDVEHDLAFIDDLQALAERAYTWAFAIDAFTGPQVTLFTDDQCLLADPQPVTGTSRGTFLVDDPDPAATHMQLGFGWTEAYDDGSTDAVSGITATMPVTPTADGLEAAWSGSVLQFDAFSGYYLAQDVAGLVGGSNLAPEADYEVTITTGDEATTLGTVTGPPVFTLTEPDLLAGDVVVRRSEDLVITWDPIANDGDPLVVAIELVVRDDSVQGPNGGEEGWRLVARADAATGRFVLRADDLAQLPDAPNAFDVNLDNTGRWAELSVGLHQLRKLARPDDAGDFVVDFMHVVNAPVRLR